MNDVKEMKMTPETKDHGTAVRVWHIILILSVIASVAVNTAHGVLGSGDNLTARVVAGVLGAIPPIVFFALVEALLKTFRAGVYGWLYWTLIVGTVTAASAAFTLSFIAVLDFARDYAVMSSMWIAWLFPIMFDVVMALSTLAIFALGDKPMKRVTKPKEAATGVSSVGLIPWLKVKFIGGAATVPPLPEQPLTTLPSVQPVVSSRPEKPATVDGGQPPAQRAVSGGRSASVSRPVGTAVTWTVDDADHLAGRLRATGKTELPIETVTAILVGFAEGQSGRALATAAGVSPTTAQTLKKAAAELAADQSADLPQLTAV